MKKTLSTIAFLALGGFAFAQEAPQNEFDKLERQEGPKTVNLGSKAEIDLPEGFIFLDAKNTKKYLELTRNFPDDSEVGSIFGDDWWVVFSYSDEGYVKDDDKSALDAKAMLENIAASCEAANKERKKRGWGTMNAIDWFKKPNYNEKTNNLEWAPTYKSTDPEGESHLVVNYNTRLLGRSGIMSVTLVMSPEQGGIMPDYEKLIAGFRYKEGSRYAEWRPGDKVAEYGLAALIGGGALAIAAKSGILQKAWKLIVVAIVAVGAAFKKFYKKIVGKD